jgi:hypothetical protein
LVTQDPRRRRLVVTKTETAWEDHMMTLKRVAYRAALLLRAVASIKWEPVPFFGVGLLAVWVWWIAIAVSR